jgi:drug/metabolite transporter (DMT)-like permease
MFAATVCFTLMAAVVKVLREAGMSTLELMAWRMAPGVPWLWWELRRKRLVMLPRRPVLMATRAALGGSAMAAYFWSMQQLSVVQNASLQLIQPIFVALLAPLFLRERSSPRVWLALFLACLGAAAVVLPNGAFVVGVAAVTAATMVPLAPALVRVASSLCSALAHISIRRLTTAHRRATAAELPPESPEAVVFYFASSVAVASVAIALAQGDLQTLPPTYPWPWAIAMLLLMAWLGNFGQLLMSRAYSHAQAPRIAIVAYSSIPLSAAADFAIWGVAISTSELIGSAIMVLAGVILVRDHETESNPL